MITSIGSIINLNPRKISEIARDIQSNWTNPYFGAKPYISAMKCLDSINDEYGCESAKTIILYFLSNASTWRGDAAKGIKAELKKMIKGY